MVAAKDMATSMQVGLANLREGKPLKKKSRSRVHILLGLLVLGAVAAAGAYVAKRGLPDIDPVKVRENALRDPLRTVPRPPSAPDPAPRILSLVPRIRTPRGASREIIVTSTDARA